MLFGINSQEWIRPGFQLNIHAITTKVCLITFIQNIVPIEMLLSRINEYLFQKFQSVYSAFTNNTNAILIKTELQ